tara:strand:- start:899 stop:1618 length:720 start_codon:yes stop_codon:yes gene_type:complete
MNNSDNIIAELTTRIGQYDTWNNKYHDPKVGGYAHKNALAQSKTAKSILETSKTEKTMTSEEKEDFFDEAEQVYHCFYVALQTLKNEKKGIPSPMPRGGGSRLPDEITSVFNAQSNHLKAALLPAILSIWSVFGELVRVSQGQGGISYTAAGKTAEDYVDYYVNRVIDGGTKGAYRLHAKGFTTEDLSNVAFLEEKKIFNSLYLTTDKEGTFIQTQIEGVPLFTLGRTMLKPKESEDNS